MVVVNRDVSFTVDPPVSDHPKCKELAMADPDLQIREGWGRSQEFFFFGPMGLSLVQKQGGGAPLDPPLVSGRLQEVAA